jgi:hypothetical protein
MTTVIHSRRLQICLACKRPFPPMLLVTGSRRQKLVNIVAGRPDGIEIGDLVDQLYADCIDGGPLWAMRSANVMIHKANRQLAPQGYVIKAMWLGRGARYRLGRIGHKPDRASSTPNPESLHDPIPAQQESPPGVSR